MVLVFSLAMDRRVKLAGFTFVVFILHMASLVAHIPLFANSETDNKQQHRAGSLLDNWMDFCTAGYCPPAHAKLMHLVALREAALLGPEGIPPEDDTDKECKLAIERYAVYAANFTYCTVKFARPITFCEQCIEYHDRAEHEMNILKSLSNTHKHKDNTTRSCHDIMTNSDRIHLLEQSDQFLTSVWEESNCDRCFHNHSIDEIDQFTFTYSTDLSMFQKLHTEAVECFRQFGPDFVVKNDSNAKNRSAACIECADEYNRLNAYYVDVEKRAAEVSGLCMDMVDLMNYTRQTWSNVFQCKSQRINDPALLAVSLFLLLFGLTFYVSSKIQTGFEAYKIRKQQRLTQQQIEENAAAASAVAANSMSRFASSRRSNGELPSFSAAANNVNINNNPRNFLHPSHNMPFRRPNPAGFDVFGQSYDAFGSYMESDSMNDATSSMLSASAVGSTSGLFVPGSSYAATNNIEELDEGRRVVFAGGSGGGEKLTLGQQRRR